MNAWRLRKLWNDDLLTVLFTLYTIFIYPVHGHAIFGVKDLCKIYQPKISFFNNKSTKYALKGLTLTYDPQITTFIGSSGCGKSTLVKISVGMESLTSGTVNYTPEVNNQHKHHHIKYSYMDPLFYLSYNEHENIADIFQNEGNKLGTTVVLPQYIIDALDMFGIKTIEAPNKMKISQKKIFEILLALLRLECDEKYSPSMSPVLVLDEYLDKELSYIHLKIQPLLKWLCVHPLINLQVLIVTHSSHVWNIYSDKTIVLNNGQLYDQGLVGKVTLPYNFQFM